MESLERAGDESMEDVFLQDDLSPTIAEHATKCQSLFKYIVMPKIVPDPTIMDDQMARFSLWASNMDVYGPFNISLDYRLRFSPTAADIIHQLLDIICDTLLSMKPIDDRPTQISSRKRQRMLVHENSAAADRANDEASDSENDVNPGEENILKITDTIGGTLTRLFRLSNVARKSAKANRARKIERYRDDKEANKAIEELRLYTKPYIEFRFPETPEALCSGLVEANALRLRRLYYQRSHLNRRRINLSVPSQVPEPAVVQLPKMKGNAPAVRFAPSALPTPPTTNKMSAPSTASATNATTARQRAVAAMYAQFTSEVPQAKSVLVNNKLSFPSIPPTQQCPYCGDIIEFKDTEKSLLWQDHVITDLEPFICLFPHCLEGDHHEHGTGPLTFETSKAWCSHMQTAHGHAWECRAPSHDPVVFDQENQYQEHAINEHGVPEAHAGTLSNAARRPILDKVLECPFGDDFEPSGKVESSAVFSSEDLQSHIAGHMKEIALLTLQKLPSDDYENTENVGDPVSKEIREYAPRDFREVGWQDDGEPSQDFKSSDQQPGDFFPVTRRTTRPALPNMEQYRMFCPGPSRDCKSLAYVARLHDCLWSRLDQQPEDFFDQPEFAMAEGSIFFSRKETKALFSRKNILDLLDCRCRDCLEYSTDISTLLNFLDYLKRFSNPEENMWLLVAALVYLGQLHLIHRFLRYPNIIHDLRSASELFEPPFEKTQQNILFWKAYARVMHTFFPLEIQPGINGRPEQNQIVKDRHFPYLDEPGVIPSGSSGSSVTRFLVPEEYIHESFGEMMENNYAKSVKSGDRGRMYRLVRKVLVRKSLKDMEHITLRMTSSRQDQKNLINLMALYEWREQIHVIFPFVETHLDKVLLDEWPFPELTQIRNPADHGLWRQMIGVCEALKTIHFDLKSPWGTEQVIAFHFDLKPVNLLVTADGIVKITDFGNSMIQIMLPEEEKKGFYRGGDPVYRAPEPTPDSGQVKEASETRNNAHKSQDYSEELPRNQLFLNYDVWQLACIMTEVLIWITGKSQHREEDQSEEKGHVIKTFRQEKRDEDGRDAFFTITKSEGSEIRSLKKVVSERLRLLQTSDTEDANVEEYMKSTIGILSHMFEIDPLQRFHSLKALRTLEAVNQKYDMSRQGPGDPVLQKIKEHAPRGFGEVGWQDKGEIRSFLEMRDVRFRKENPLKTTRECACMFRVLYSRATGMLRIFYGVKEQDRLDAMLSNPEKLMLSVEKSYIIPSYLNIQRDGRFVCTVFSADDTDDILSFSFASREDAHKFQYALTRQKVEWESEIGSIERATFSLKKPKKQELEMSSNVKMQLWSCWKDDICEVDFGLNRHLSSPDRKKFLKQILVIFEESGPFLIIPFNNGQKRFLDHIQTVVIKDFRGFKDCDLYRPPESFPCIAESSKHERSVNDYIKRLGYITPAVPLDQAKFQSKPWQLAADLKKRPSKITFSSQGKADMSRICEVAKFYGEYTS